MNPLLWAWSREAENWYGPVADVAEALLDAKRSDYWDEDCPGIYIAEGRFLDPADQIDSRWLFDWLDDGGENCPTEESWPDYWGVKEKEEYEALDVLLREAFRKWADERNLRKFYLVDGLNAVFHPFSPEAES